MSELTSTFSSLVRGEGRRKKVRLGYSMYLRPRPDCQNPGIALALVPAQTVVEVQATVRDSQGMTWSRVTYPGMPQANEAYLFLSEILDEEVQ